MSCIQYFLAGDKSLTMRLEGRLLSCAADHPNYEKVLEELRKGEQADEAALVKLVDRGKAVEQFGRGNLEVKDGQILRNGQPIHNVVVDRIFDHIAVGLDPKPLLAFLDNLLLNPSYTSQNQLYDFLSNKFLPLTHDGCFLSYKAVNPDYTDKYSGTFSNKPGTIVEIERGMVDDNRGHTCSKGLHVGAIDYCRWYGPQNINNSGTEYRIVVVKVRPQDVVSVPSDHNAQKCRVCRYEVLSDFQDELAAPVYNSNLTQYDKWDDDSYDDEDVDTYDRGWDDQWDEEEDIENTW